MAELELRNDEFSAEFESSSRCKQQIQTHCLLPSAEVILCGQWTQSLLYSGSTVIFMFPAPAVWLRLPYAVMWPYFN